MAFGSPIFSFPAGDDYYGYGEYGAGDYGGEGYGGWGLPVIRVQSPAFGALRFQESVGLRWGQRRVRTPGPEWGSEIVKSDEE